MDDRMPRHALTIQHPSSTADHNIDTIDTVAGSRH